jgi:hypothetical protein
LCFIRFTWKRIKEKKKYPDNPVRIFRKKFNSACSAYFSEAPQSGTSGRETKKTLPKRVQQPEIKAVEAKFPIA